MVRFAGVSVVKDGRPILRDIDLELGERRVGVIGRNGSGKSTFARLFNGIERPTEGTVSIGGASDSKALRRQVGFVFQNPDNQIVYPIVAEDLEFGLKNLGLEPAERRARVAFALDRFGLRHLAERRTHELSGGEKQLVALAGVMVMEPRLIVFDEPTTLLDLWNKRRFMASIDALDEQVVLVSHDLELLERFDRVLHFEGGRIVDDGDPESVIRGYLARSAC